ncbi:MAG: AAA family ATPase, partial [Synechococcaceae cyanobacterium]|nr:AAA family ATPase [Synechococcaceae cyanobacterium]
MDPLIASLLRPEAYPHPTGRIELRETHSAWVLLTGPYAYKLRKPVNFGFLDFSTLERRRFFAAEELRLNRRLAPDLYLDLVNVQGPPERAQLGGEEPGIEVAVRMRQFDEQQLLSLLASRGPLADTALDGLAGELARFHSQAATAPADGPYGTPAAVRQPVDDNLKVLDGVPELAEALTVALTEALAELQCWLEAEAVRLEPFFGQRLRDGHIRECHGDLHLGNLWLENGRIRVFDCLEFNPGLRWIDTISELAFLVMDLQVRGQEQGGLRLLNGWLDLCGDWQGLRSWRWYSVYRALVRAKVAELRRRQGGSSEAAAERDRYVQRALLWCRPRPRALVLTHGVSGSGKSWLSERLAPRLGALRLRSDVERKRLFGLWGEPRRTSLSGDPYRAEVSELLFSHTLPSHAEAVLAGGFTALVDATFLRQDDRRPFLELAERLGVPLLILALPCPAELARARIAERQRLGRDPSDAGLEVLERQLRIIEPLTSSERAAATVVEVEPDTDPAALALQLKAPLQLEPL